MGATVSRNKGAGQSFRCILITGASNGIGAALAISYAAPGVTLALIGRNEGRLQTVAAACLARGAQVHAATINVTDAAALADFIQKVDRQRPIDLVVANAGMMAQERLLPHGLLAAADTNIIGTLNTLALVLEARLVGGTIKDGASEHGPKPKRGAPIHGPCHIALVSSVSALPHGSAKFAGGLQLGLLPYAWTKQSLLALAQGLGRELHGSGVTVSAVCPGVVVTDLARGLSDACSGGQQHLGELGAISADEAAQHIQRGLARRKAVVAFPNRAVRTMAVMECLPQGMLLALVKRGLAQRKARAAAATTAQSAAAQRLVDRDSSVGAGKTAPRGGDQDGAGAAGQAARHLQVAVSALSSSDQDSRVSE